METYEQQTLPFGETVSTCSPADFPASRSASRASARARRTTATSGRKCCGLFGLFDPVGSWARTFSELLIGRKEWSSTRCVLTWKRQDTKCGRTLYRLAVSALLTDGTDAGLLPTVQTPGLKQCEKGKTVFMPLELLPTPTAIDAGSGRINRSLSPGAADRQSHWRLEWDCCRCLRPTMPRIPVSRPAKSNARADCPEWQCKATNTGLERVPDSIPCLSPK